MTAPGDSPAAGPGGNGDVPDLRSARRQLVLDALGLSLSAAAFVLVYRLGR